MDIYESLTLKKMAIDKAWMKAFGFTSQQLNRNFYITILCLFIAVDVFVVSKYFEMQKKLETEKNARIQDQIVFADKIQEKENEKIKVINDANSLIYEIINKYDKKIEKYLR